MTEITDQAAKDWAGNLRSYALAWGVATLAIVAGAFVGAPERTVIWTVALIWKGTACLINARRCGRVHCRFTGPFYFLLIVPVVLQGTGLVSLGPYAWWILGTTILIGGKILWWATETAWGKFSAPLDARR